MNKLFYFACLVLSSCQLNSQTDTVENSEQKITLNSNVDLSTDSLIIQAISNEVRKDVEANTVIRYKQSTRHKNMFEPYDSIVPGFKIKAIEESQAYAIIDAYFDKAKETGSYLFLTNLSFDDAWNTQYDLVLAPVPNQIALIRFVGTEPVNYGLSTEDVVEWFEQKETEFDFEIIVADLSRIEARLTSEPKSYRKLAKEIYKFCPDVIDQGHEDMNELIEYLETTQHMWFWWD
jgi:hypothetical protein